MRFGACFDPDKVGLVEKLGYDFFEGSVAQFAAMTDAEFEEIVKLFDKSSIRCEVNRSLFPGDMKLIGPELTEDAIRAYLKKAFARVRRLGTEIVVFGSGAARKAPESVRAEDAWARLVAVSRIVAEEAAPYGIVCVVEPLNRMETNMINSQLDGLKLVQDVGHPNFRVLSEYFHLTVMGEGPAEVEACAGYMAHTHIANPNGRGVPLSTEESDYASFFRALRNIGYDGRMSVEAVVGDAEPELGAALQVLRTLDGAKG